jgi:hypothetical protein
MQLPLLLPAAAEIDACGCIVNYLKLLSELAAAPLLAVCSSSVCCLQLLCLLSAAPLFAVCSFSACCLQLLDELPSAPACVYLSVYQFLVTYWGIVAGCPISAAGMH